MCLFIALIAEIQFLLLLFLSFASSLAAHIKLNFWARSCHVKSLSYQHPLCLSPGCYLIGFHPPSAGSPARPASLAWAAELCAKSACDWFAYSWQVENCIFFLFYFFFILFLSLWQLAIYASLMPSWWYVERPHWLLLPSSCACTHISSALFVLRLLSNFSITSIQFARFGFAALNKWPQLR